MKRTICLLLCVLALTGCTVEVKDKPKDEVKEQLKQEVIRYELEKEVLEVTYVNGKVVYGSGVYYEEYSDEDLGAFGYMWALSIVYPMFNSIEGIEFGYYFVSDNNIKIKLDVDFTKISDAELSEFKDMDTGVESIFLIMDMNKEQVEKELLSMGYKIVDLK